MPKLSRQPDTQISVLFAARTADSSPANSRCQSNAHLGMSKDVLSHWTATNSHQSAASVVENAVLNFRSQNVAFSFIFFCPLKKSNINLSTHISTVKSVK